MQEFGIDKDFMIIDKQSGKDFERPGYKRLIKKLKPGDTVVIKSIDRLGRDYDEIIEQWRFLTKDLHLFIVVLDMPLLDTRNGRDLTGTLITDIVLHLLSYVAQTEREFIRQRQREGIQIARAKGIHIGRKAMKRPSNYNEVKTSWERGEFSGRTAAKKLGISHTTFRMQMRAEKKQLNELVFTSFTYSLISISINII